MEKQWMLNETREEQEGELHSLALSCWLNVKLTVVVVELSSHR